MYLYGTGGIGVVAADALRDNGVAISGFVDDNDSLAEFQGLEVLSPEAFNERCLMEDISKLICIGDNFTRAILSHTTRGSHGNAIHNSVLLGGEVTTGMGSIFFHRSVVQYGAKLGNGVILNTACSVDHDCQIGDYVHISPNTALSGGVTVGTGANIGTGTAILPNLRIGKWTTIGAGTTVIKDVPDYATVVGTPGRVIKYLSDERIREIETQMEQFYSRAS